ncbi:AAA family ATPase [Leptolyngbya sp. FACHB-261]|uniref:AAA family ATPase n=1 Tax=Leptolyngbya sp. FACHB-261 TaxID=2692806 RepID=UPI0016849940|nr:SMC family ATPase [Leptolyngbya sp. FACHB-261]MBD2105080.1 SMC family ATPase [Leptolyngbya sp. FACHB-261]
MEILSVSLKNFKSHTERQFKFEPGINAISGENGAGKTSILEAIAWVLFDHTPYKIEEMVRNGANSGQAIVTFISKRDGRTYEVHRCTSQGYKILDPQLKVRLEHERKVDVLRWLNEHLAVPAGTKLDELFANTIGVPQGTLTADFLKTAEPRKKVFDSILKVEEYKEVYTKLKPLEDYAKAQVEEVERQIQGQEEQLAQWEPLQTEQQASLAELTKLQTELAQALQALERLQAEKATLEATEQTLQALREQAQALKGQQTAQDQLCMRLRQDVQTATQAAQVCEQNQPSYQAYLAAEKVLQQLEQARNQRQTLLEQRNQQQAHITNQQRTLDRLQAQLEQLAKYARERQDLLPAVQQQVGLETAQQQLSEQLRHCQTLRLELQAQAKRTSQLATRRQEIETRRQKLEALRASVEKIPVLEQHQQRLQQKLSRVEAAKEFEADLRQIADTGWEKIQTQQPQWQQACQRLAHSDCSPILPVFEAATSLSAEVLNELEGILDDLATQTTPGVLQQQLNDLASQLKQARTAQAQWLGMESLEAELEQLDTEQQELQHTIETLKAKLAVEPELQQQATALATQLRDLQDPRSRVQLLNQELQQQASREQEIAALQLKLQPLHNQLAQLDTQLATFGDLEAQVLTHQQIRDQSRAGYQTVLEQQTWARSLPSKQQELQAASQLLAQVQQEYDQIVEQGKALRATHNPERLQEVKAAYDTANEQQIRLSEKIPRQQQRLAELEASLAMLQSLRLERDQAVLRLKERKRLSRFIAFVRKVYRAAGPRITERYLQAISHEADRLFRDLLNRQDVALQWTRDYDVVVQEGAHSRRFINLSGGEQMCAALAVRLALLKVLADIDVAFFDEPTTNMDTQRRERLAEAIMGIRNFRQLFVISHDDTFEKVTENVILVERER